MNYRMNERDHVVLSSHITTNLLPASIDLTAHSLDISGLQGGSTWSGVFGLASAKRSLWLAQKIADERQQQCLTVRTWVKLKDLEANRGKMSVDQVSRTGFLHLGGIKASLRDKLHDDVLMALRNHVSGGQIGNLQKLVFDDLLLRYPIAAEFLLDALPAVTLVVHPAHLVAGDGRAAWIGTLRKQDLQHYRSEVRNLESICTAA
jgi:hypothetical protein